MLDFGDIQPEIDKDRAVVPLKDLLGKSFTVIGCKAFKREDKDRVAIDIILDGKRFVCFTSCIVVMKQIKQTSDKVPYTASLKQVKNYYQLTSAKGL